MGHNCIVHSDIKARIILVDFLTKKWYYMIPTKFTYYYHFFKEDIT